ncbi:MAG: hypothetical protein ACUVTW_15720 [Thermogutta sp.]
MSLPSRPEGDAFPWGRPRSGGEAGLDAAEKGPAQSRNAENGTHVAVRFAAYCNSLGEAAAITTILGLLRKRIHRRLTQYLSAQ